MSQGPLHEPAHAAPRLRGISLPGFLRRERIGGQAARFIIVGLSNTVVDLVIFSLLRLVIPDVAAKAISYCCGIVNSFVWNKYWTFGAGGSAKGRREFLIFFAVNVPPMAVNVVVFTLLGFWIGHSSFWVRTGRAFLAAVITIAWNFFGSRYLAFRHAAVDDARATHGVKDGME